MAGRVKRIWTIGYEGHDVESLVLRLRKARIERVVDIRELPLSRKAGFSKKPLAAGLEHIGIQYSHLRALGTPRVVRHAYRAGGPFEDFRDAYLAHVEGNQAALAELETLARAQRCALLCVEADASACHRSVLTDVLAARGWRAEHL